MNGAVPATRAEAMVWAGSHRASRAEVERSLTTGARTLRSLLSDPEGPADEIKVLTVVEAVPGLGKVRSRRLLASLSIGEGCRVGAIGPAEREALVNAVEAAAAGGVSA